MDELNALDSSVETIIVDNNACGDRSFTVLNLTRFVNLRVFEVGNNCFNSVEEVYMTGLSKLERVVIGENCFTMFRNGWGNDPNRHFHLKDCESLRELKMDRYSFSDYSLIEIENVDSLEVIEIGKVNEESSNFFYASLELKSKVDEMK